MLKKSLVVAGAIAMLSLAAPAAAHADVTSGDGSVLGGNQVFVPISIPVNICGVAVAVLGHSGAGCKGGANSGRY